MFRTSGEKRDSSPLSLSATASRGRRGAPLLRCRRNSPAASSSGFRRESCGPEHGWPADTFNSKIGEGVCRPESSGNSNPPGVPAGGRSAGEPRQDRAGDLLFPAARTERAADEESGDASYSVRLREHSGSGMLRQFSPRHRRSMPPFQPCREPFPRPSQRRLWRPPVWTECPPPSFP